MGAYDIRIIGDPVLRQCAGEVREIDGRLVPVVSGMVAAMREAGGIGLAAPQVGVQKRLFVWDVGDGLRAIVNPEIVESDGEWAFDEGCLSVPGLSWEIIRPKRVHVVGRDLNGNEMSLEADELEARLFQHELDHLDGKLLIEHLDRDDRKAALKTIRQHGIGPAMGASRSRRGVWPAKGEPLPRDARTPKRQEPERPERRRTGRSVLGGLRLR